MYGPIDALPHYIVFDRENGSLSNLESRKDFSNEALHLPIGEQHIRKLARGSQNIERSARDSLLSDFSLKKDPARIFDDNTTGDWVLHAGRGADKRVGHWPKSLFTNLAEAASFVQFVVQFGAFVSYHPVDRAPPMGSGHFPDDCDKRAAYLKDAFVFNPVDEADVPSPVVVQSKPDCYRVGGGYRSYARDYIGGPGGCSA
ncbi:uncharacterized protein A4U43_C02F20600 [Asparagus officinalis]|uniref:Neprosin PEP catalytic domain-containing protein n=1 Tax=Asparagus officinalis TaxID=4686 RepID=A0A5P1FNR9_ASPOF|nr:uncharacterized protein A4U43_C02F20600 [Asparagus officinalis]